ncbi:MAG: LacI family DNA-binding transcriptional regulator, partial [Pyrinomonadaceae bacterium]
LEFQNRNMTISDDMPKRDNPNQKKIGPRKKGDAVSLKDLALHLGLSTTTLSLVLNESPQADSIPADTKKRIFDGARELNYRPNYLARSLRVQKTNTLHTRVKKNGHAICNGFEWR